MRGTFLDISKTFGKVWLAGLIFKLKTYGVERKLKTYGFEGDLLNLLKNYLTDRQQRVALNDRTSSWQIVYAGVSQGSVLISILFLLCINDLPNGLTSMCKIFANDTSLFSKVIDKNNSNSKLNFDPAKTSKWNFHWKMSFNPDPIKQAIEVRFCNKDKKTLCLYDLTVETNRELIARNVYA